MKKKMMLVVAVMLIFVVFLTACSSDTETSTTTDTEVTDTEATVDTEGTEETNTEENVVEPSGEEAAVMYYYAEAPVDSKGWVATVTYVVNGTDVVKADFDAYYAEGEEYPLGTSKKSLAQDGTYDIIKAGGKASWSDEIAWVEATFVENDTLDNIAYDEEGHETDGTTGATIHFAEYNELVKSAMPALMYYGEGEVGNGWIPTVTYLQSGDNIIWADFDAYYAEGEDFPLGTSKKKASQDGLYDIEKAGGKASWDQEIMWVEKAFVLNNTLDNIAYDEEGHETDGTTGATIHFSEYNDLVSIAKETPVYFTYSQGSETSNGWLSTAITGTVAEDVVYADFDGLYAEGEDFPLGYTKKDAVANGLYDMIVAGAKADWSEQISWLENYYIANDTLSHLSLDDTGLDADGITGATIHLNGYVGLVK